MVNGTENKDVVKLLWTGGWDSTFRLLSLLFIEKKVVQPVYLIEYGRRSSLNELSAMDAIKHKTIEKSPDLAHLLMPTQIFLSSEIAPCLDITGKFRSLASRFRLGSQFEWLPRFAEQHGLYGLELAIEKNELRPRDPVFDYLGRFLTEDDGILRLASNVSDEDLLIFKYFHFPLYFMTKLQMLEIAKRAEFYDIMLHSWFCHHPRHDKACGMCHPCIDAMEEGFSFRLPRLSRAHYHFGKLLRGFKAAVPGRGLIRTIVTHGKATSAAIQ